MTVSQQRMRMKFENDGFSVHRRFFFSPSPLKIVLCPFEFSGSSSTEVIWLLMLSTWLQLALEFQQAVDAVVTVSSWPIFKILQLQENEELAIKPVQQRNSNFSIYFALRVFCLYDNVNIFLLDAASSLNPLFFLPCFQPVDLHCWQYTRVPIYFLFMRTTDIVSVFALICTSKRLQCGVS